MHATKRIHRAIAREIFRSKVYAQAHFHGATHCNLSDLGLSLISH